MTAAEARDEVATTAGDEQLDRAVGAGRELGTGRTTVPGAIARQRRT